MNWVKIIRMSLVLAVLIVCAVSDYRKKEIKLIFPVFLAIAAAAMFFLGRDIAVKSVIAGMAEGIVIIVLSQITQGRIGMGDGVLLASTGLMLGWKDNLIMFFFACLLSACVSVLILTLKKGDRETKIPFIPFMVPGFLISVLIAVK